MKPFTKILVAHDFSHHSDRALAVAADLARRYEASLCVLHVHEPELYASSEAYLLRRSDEQPQVIEALALKLRHVGEQLSALGALVVDTQVRWSSKAAAEIASYAAEGGYDLVVMATHGRTGLGHALLGSVAERVVRSAPCPVLTVRDPGQPVPATR